MEVRYVAALIIALLTFACVVGAYLRATRESRAERRGHKRYERARLDKAKKSVADAAA